MVSHYPVESLIESLCRLRDRLFLEFIPEEVIKHAIEQNPWFSPYYIQRSLKGIRSWLDRETLTSYLHTHDPAVLSQKIGIITAGNVPLVGFQDVLNAILCGHTTLIRPSHQDSVLMQWILTQWQTFLPELEKQYSLVSHIQDADFILATGSNNTARHLHSQYGAVQRLIRHNRYSVAILDGSESDEQLHRLSQDIFLYNGLGCRNVSNVLISPEFDVDRWVRILAAYPAAYLTSHYQQKLTYERARLDLLNQAYIDAKHVLIKYSNAIDFARMGIIYLIKVSSKEESIRIVRKQQEHIQCVVNLDTEIGETQIPGLNDFADNVNTLALFANLN